MGNKESANIQADNEEMLISDNIAIKMQEIISIHTGQAGVQLGSACWEQFGLENHLDPAGMQLSSAIQQTQEGASIVYSLSASNKHTPRALFIDTEPTALDNLRAGPYRQLYDPQQFVSGKEDASHNYARGYSMGKEMMELILERVRKLAESCRSLEGFMLYHGIGGGTGSGLMAQLLQSLSAEYNKKQKVSWTIYPSSCMSSSVVEPYNTILSMRLLTELMDTTIVYDNSAVHNICQSQLEVPFPIYDNLNYLMAHTVACLTAGARFDGSLLVNLREYQTSLVPYHRIHYTTVSYSPLYPRTHTRNLTTSEVSMAVFQPACMFAKINPQHGKYMATSLMYRGDVVPKDVGAACGTIKTKRMIQYVDWCPTGYKCGIVYQSPVYSKESNLVPNPRNLCMISNTAAISELFSRVSYKFNALFAKRAFVHSYVSAGMEEAEFSLAYEDMQALLTDYEEVCLNNEDNTE